MYRYAQSSYFGPRGPLLGWHVLDSYSLTYPWSDSSQHSDGAHYGRPDEFSRQVDHEEGLAGRRIRQRGEAGLPACLPA